ncbi:hypothetical protein P8452_33581 [Trifolium repens]|nr:protein RGF1 INDUCIBLE TRANSCRIPTION FACTOR [Trifolium repens]WJX46825.1 hypothetical protein P8452_33581 [Trifolium repens]
MMKGEKVPAWLERLMAETFFGVCGVHINRRKNENNIFCLQCCLAICPHCLPSHPHHPLLQVRRYVYHDVVRLGDLEKLIDCSNIQPYTINGAKVVFLNERVQSRSCKGSSSSNANSCCFCDRILQEPFHFCSLSCKVDNMVCMGESLSSILHGFLESDFSYSQFEGLRVDSSEVIDEDNTQFAPTFSYSNTEEATSHSMNNISCEEPYNKNNNKSNGFFLSLGSCRRKGAPKRSPLS